MYVINYLIFLSKRNRWRASESIAGNVRAQSSLWIRIGGGDDSLVIRTLAQTTLLILWSTVATRLRGTSCGEVPVQRGRARGGRRHVCRRRRDTVAGRARQLQRWAWPILSVNGIDIYIFFQKNSEKPKLSWDNIFSNIPQAGVFILNNFLSNFVRGVKHNYFKFWNCLSQRHGKCL